MTDEKRLIWVSEHDALRADMNDLAAAMGVLDSQLAAGKALTAWQVTTFCDFWAQFCHAVEHHHINEEGVFFPWIETRAKLPPKLTADHKTLIGMLVTCSESVDTMSKAGSSTSADTVQALRQMYGQLHPGASDHFQEEEEASLPLIRQHFTLNELKEMEAQVMLTYKPSDVAWIVRTLTTPSAKREWMTSVAGISASVLDKAMMPAAHQRDACLEVPFKALLKGATEAPQEV